MRSSLLKNKSELKRWAGLLFVLPAFIYHFIVVIVPSIKTLYLSFFDWNGIGNPVYPPAKKELARHGISCDKKRAVQMCRADYEKYEYLIGMDDRNISNMIRIAGGDPAHKIYKLLMFADDPGDIADPWYTGEFGRTYEDIVRGCEGLLKHLIEK